MDRTTHIPSFGNFDQRQGNGQRQPRLYAGQISESTPIPQSSSYQTPSFPQMFEYYEDLSSSDSMRQPPGGTMYPFSQDPSSSEMTDMTENSFFLDSSNDRGSMELNPNINRSPILEKRFLNSASSAQTPMVPGTSSGNGLRNDETMGYNLAGYGRDSTNLELRPSPRHSLRGRATKRHRPASSQRQTSSHEKYSWLANAICSLWRRNNFDKPDLAELNLISDAFDISSDEIHDTWRSLYGSAGRNRLSTPASLKARYIDAFCALWRLAHLEVSKPSDIQLNALSQMLRADVSELQLWFEDKASSGTNETSEDIKAEAIGKYKNNQKECLKQPDGDYNCQEFKLPLRDSLNPLVCTTGCGRSFSKVKDWKRHEEKNWPQKMWCCSLRDCPKRKQNKHIFFRPDTFGDHVSSCHREMKNDVQNMKNQSKQSDFSKFPRHCVFRDCEENITTWKHRMNHLEHEFKTREWLPEDWRDVPQEAEPEDDSMDDASDYSSDDEAGAGDGGNSGAGGHDRRGNDFDNPRNDDNNGGDDDDHPDDDSGGQGARKGNGRHRATNKTCSQLEEDLEEGPEGDPEEDPVVTSEDETDSAYESGSDAADSSTSISSFSTTMIQPTAEQEPNNIPEYKNATASLLPFEFEPLESQRHIRLLKLKSKVSWEIIHATLADVPAYTALSYTWSSEPTLRPVICNDQLLEVPVSCFEALDYLRKSRVFRKDQLIWVDAVCIDHSNVTERNTQALLMAEIYRKAARAIVWLGKPKATGTQGLADLLDGNRSISLVTFDDVIHPKKSKSLMSQSVSDCNEKKAFEGGPVVIQSLDEHNTSSSEAIGNNSMTSSVLSLPGSGRLVQSFQFQMGYQCFDESAMQVQSWLTPDSETPLGQTGTCRVDRVSFNKGRYIFARKTSQLKSKSQLFFPQEAVTMRRLNHPHIVRLVLGYLTGDMLSILMEPVADGNLQQYLISRSQFQPPRRENWKWFACLASGLLYMHDKGLRHRDIKPSNILLKGNDIIYADLGLSNDQYVDSSEDGFIGNFTRQYAAPEFADGQRGKSSDIWSLGCVYLELLTVLSGQSVTKLYDFGKGDPAYYKNPRLLRRWISKLKASLLSQVPRDSFLVTQHKLVKAVIFASEEMTYREPVLRPSARELSERLGPNPCCGAKGSQSAAYEVAGSMFLQQLHWNMLNYIVNPQQNPSEESCFSDLDNFRSLVSRLSQDTRQNYPQNELHKQVRQLADQFAQHGLSHSGADNRNSRTNVEFEVNQTLELNNKKDTKEGIAAVCRDLVRRLDYISQAAGKTKGSITLSEATELEDPEPESPALPCEAYLDNLKLLPQSKFEAPITQCCYTYRSNDQLLLSAAWFVYTELGWSLKEALKIAVSSDAPPGSGCQLTVNSIYNQIDSIRFDQSVRSVRKTIEDSRIRKVAVPQMPQYHVPERRTGLRPLLHEQRFKARMNFHRFRDWLGLSKHMDSANSVAEHVLGSQEHKKTSCVA